MWPGNDCEVAAIVVVANLNEVVADAGDDGVGFVSVGQPEVHDSVSHTEYSESSQRVVSHGAKFTGGAGFRSSADGSSGM